MAREFRPDLEKRLPEFKALFCNLLDVGLQKHPFLTLLLHLSNRVDDNWTISIYTTKK